MTTLDVEQTIGTLAFRGTALVHRGGRDVVRYAGGTLGSDPDGPIELDTRFQLCSVSKQFTAAATLLLVDRGRLRIDDHVAGLLDGCPPEWDEITVHDLLCHTAGLVHWRELDSLDLCAPLDPAELMARFAAAPLLGTPGKRHAYSSPGYVLLAWIVERVSGVPYRTFLADELFGPLGMSGTFAGNGRGEANLAAPTHDGNRVKSFELDTVGIGAGDVWSTVDDLSRWDQALLEGTVLTATARAHMFEPQAPVTETFEGVEFYGYGYGWYLGDVFGHRAVFHPGDNAGFEAINVLLPDDDARFIALTNDSSTDILELAIRLLSVAVGEDL